MGLPRATKIDRIPVPDDEAPHWHVTLKHQDPYGLGPSEPWLRIDASHFPTPDRLEIRDGDGWREVGEGVWRIHNYLGPACAIVSRNQCEIFAMDTSGNETPIWHGPKLIEIHGGIWGDNWMFSAVGLPGKRWLVALPDVDDPTLDEKTWSQKLVYFGSVGETEEITCADVENRSEVHSLPLPIHSNTQINDGESRRYKARELHPGAGGRVVIIPNQNVMAVGVYASELKWIGKTTMPRGGGGVFVDGEEILLSTSLADSKVSWRRLDGLGALWEKKHPK